MGTMLVKDWDWEMAVKVANEEGFLLEQGYSPAEAKKKLKFTRPAKKRTTTARAR